MAQPSYSSAKSTANQAASKLESGYKELQGRAREYMDTSSDFVADHPMSSVLGACAVGFVAGMLIRSRRW